MPKKQQKECGALAPAARSSGKLGPNPPSPKANAAQKSHPAEPQLVQIEKPIYGGSFLAHLDGKALFVPLTLPGEQARIRITQTKSGYSTAEALQIVAPAPERIPAPCPHFGACGGCNYQHAPYPTQLQIKETILRETLDRAGVPPPATIETLAANPWAYRNRVRLALDADGNPGYRSRRSHAIIPIAACPIAAPLLFTAAQAAAEILARVPANLRPHEIQLFCDPAETALLATLFAQDGSQLRLDTFAKALSERVPALQSAELAAGGRPGHPPRTLSRWGAASITYRAAGFPFRVDHGAFFQVNRWLIDAFVESVTANATGALAWDLFAGVGLFARTLTSHFAQVIAVESAPSATAALEHNLQATTGKAVTASALDFLRANPAARPDLIVVDPPRTGLGSDVTTRLAQIAAPALTYVSCDPATLARDLRALLTSGYAIEKIALADLFPQTFHLETIVHLRRS